MFKALTKSAEPKQATKELPAMQPRADIYAGDERALLIAELPGVSPDKVELHVECDRLTIRGDTDHVRFERSFVLGQAIDRNAIQAECRNGVLRVTLPFAKASVQRIDVRAA